MPLLPYIEGMHLDLHFVHLSILKKILTKVEKWRHLLSYGHISSFYPSFFNHIQAPRESGPLQFVKEEVTEEEKKPDFEVLTQLVSYSLQHHTEVNNCFSKCR